MIINLSTVLLLESPEIRFRRLRREWWEALPPERRAKLDRQIKAQATRREKRREIDSLLISMMSCRQSLARERYPFESAAEKARTDERTRAELSGLQFKFEKLMIKKLRLDFLGGVEVYGLTRRRMAWEAKKEGGAA